MTARLRSLERYVACLRAQAALYPVAEDFAERWELAFEQGTPLPDTLEIVEAATRALVPILALEPLDGYLRRCAQARRVPDVQRIVMTVAHGYAESRFIGMNDETCWCPAREPLMQPFPSRSALSC